jgi:hypothetical protein
MALLFNSFGLPSTEGVRQNFLSQSFPLTSSVICVALCLKICFACSVNIPAQTNSRNSGIDGFEHKATEKTELEKRICFTGQFSQLVRDTFIQ